MPSADKSHAQVLVSGILQTPLTQTQTAVTVLAAAADTAYDRNPRYVPSFGAKDRISTFS